MKIIGYGEDALTYEMLHKKMPDILGALGDKSELDDIVFLYRPSFGRGESGFGEFDAIVGTKKYIFLIESKWIYSSEVKIGAKKEITLRRPQTRRHEIFKELNERRKEGRDLFECYLDDKGSEPIKGWHIPKSNRMLTSNIKLIFNQLYPDNNPRDICNIVLLFLPQNSDNPTLPVYSVVGDGKKLEFKTLVWRYNFIVDESDEKQNRFFMFEQ